MIEDLKAECESHENYVWQWNDCIDHLAEKGLLQVWRPVAGYEGKYEVNEYGTIRKCGCETPMGQWYKHNEKYRRVRLSGPRVIGSVHRIVAQAFIPNPENKPQVNHIDNNPENNWVKNLEWCTAKENLDHARRQGRMHSHPKGAPSPTRSLSEDVVREIRAQRAETGLSYLKLANKFGTNKKTVMNICRGISYVDLLPTPPEE